jgi:hypothetical protein
MKIQALPGNVLVSDMTHGERKVGSFIIPDDNGKASGVRARWARVYSVGEGVDDIAVGEWILVQHGRWTRGVTVSHHGDDLTLWQVDYPAGVLLVSDKPQFDTFSNDIIKSEKLERSVDQ